MSPKPYRVMQPISGQFDEAELSRFEEQIVPMWHDMLRQAGGRAIGEPTVTRDENVAYGMVLTDEDGEPMLDDDGEPLRDRTRWLISATGPALRPQNT